MMPDLGRYAAEVSAAYLVSLAILALLAAGIWWRGVRVRRQLEAIEARRGRSNAKD
jgi:heme exporter protein D